MVLTARPPLGGEVLLSTRAARLLGMPEGPGAVDLPSGAQAPAVGLFEAEGPLAFLSGGGVLVTAPSGEESVSALYVVAHSPAAAATLPATVLAAIGPPDPGALRVEAPTALADVQTVVQGDLGRFGRGILVATLAVGGVLVGVGVLGQVLLRRRDLGRRRALGAGRPLLLALVVVQTGIAAWAGSLLGAATGLVILQRLLGTVPEPSFVVGTCALAVLGALLAAVPPGVLAGWRDPVAVLRTA